MNAGGEYIPAKPPGVRPPVPVRIGRLDTLSGVARELGSVYRAMRRGVLDPNDGAKLTFTLNTLGKVLELSSLEARVQRLEARHASR